MSRPLEGVRVIDLTNVIAGPLASYYLALMGAEVIKVENPGAGDLSRKMGADPSLGRKKMGVSFMAMNGNKKSITLNLKSERGKAVFLDLVRGSDIVVENYRPGTMKRLGLDYSSLNEVNPRIIYCAVSGFGQTGPLADRPSYDQIIQGFCGLMSITGDAEGPPMRAGYVVCDSAAAITAAFGMVSAIIGRERTGRGDMIDVSMLDTALSTMASWNVANFLNAGTPSMRLGNQSQSASPSGTFRTADGLINIVNNEQQQFVRLCGAIERNDLLEDPRFSELHTRFENRDAMQAILDDHLSNNTTAYWERKLTDAAVPVGPVLAIEDAVRHPQIASRGLLHEFENVPGADRAMSVPRIGFHFADGPVELRTPPPRLGEHTDEVLGHLGYAPDDVSKLRAEGVI